MGMVIPMGEEVAQGTDPNDSSDNPGVITASVLQNPFRRLNSAGAVLRVGAWIIFREWVSVWGAGLAYNGNIQTHSPMAWVAHPFEQNPRSIDTDTDGMPDYWEKSFGFDSLVVDSSTDADGDGLTNLQEFALGTDPLQADTDGDGLTDYAETNAHGSDPLQTDGDGDGYSDGEEVANGNDPASASDFPARI